MRKNFLDYNLDFGKVTASSVTTTASNFPNTINMEKSTLPRVTIACQAKAPTNISYATITLTATDADSNTITRTAKFYNNYAEISVDEELKKYPVLSLALTGAEGHAVSGTFFGFIDAYEG